LFEALACQRPVVSAHVGGQDELVTAECGLLIERSDPRTEAQDYADALSRLLRDGALRSGLGRAGRARIRQEFTLDQLGTAWSACSIWPRAGMASA
jgi:glycosyltransferase involved in cell wall biosynthesis